MIIAIASGKGIEVVGRLPYDTVVTEAMVQGQPVTEYQPEGAMARALQQSWAEIQKYYGEM